MVQKGAAKWIITITVVFAALLELIDATVVNVALPHMMGNLGATFEDIGWVVTSYSIAIVMILPVSGWLSERFGRKNYFMASIIIFTLASFFCGNAHSLEGLIFFRVIQGLAGGGMAPTAQAVLIETWPTEDLGMAMAMFGMGVVMGPLLGPVLGGYITEHFSWSWCFYINIPLSAVALFFISAFIPKEPAIGKGKPVDWWGLIFLCIAIGSLQIFLERGEKEDWFDTFYIIVAAYCAVIFLIVFIWRELRTDHPIVNLRVFRHKSFVLGVITTMIFGMGMFGTVFISPLMYQNLLGFSAEQTGFISVPGALVTIAMMPFVGRLLKGRTPPQLLACCGVGVFIVFCMMMNKTTLAFGNHSFILPIMIRGFGLSLLFIPITTMAVQDLRGREIGQGTGLNTMMRQLGNSIGIALITIFVDRRMAYHKNILSDHINGYSNTTLERINELTHSLMQSGMDADHAQRTALTAINGMVTKQSMLLTYTDVFWAVGILFILIIPLLLAQKFKPQSDEALARGA